MHSSTWLGIGTWVDAHAVKRPTPGREDKMVQPPNLCTIAQTTEGCRW
jgi:hypothetical protein